MSLRLTDAQELTAAKPQQLETNVNHSAQAPVSGSPDESEAITQVRFHVGETEIELVEMPQQNRPQAGAEKPKSVDKHQKAEKKAMQAQELEDIKETKESAENPILKRIYLRSRRVDPDAVDAAPLKTELAQAKAMLRESEEILSLEWGRGIGLTSQYARYVESLAASYMVNTQPKRPVWAQIMKGSF